MTETRQQIADVLLTAAVVGVGLVTGNPVIATVVGGIGINWASELTRGGWQAACRKLLGSSGLLNHDLQQALARAFRQALAHLEQAWWETPHAKHMRRAQPDVARETAQAFKMLQTDAEKYCQADGISRAANNEQVRQLLYSDETTAVRIMDGCLAGYLHGHDPLLIAFLDKHLVQALAFWFGEELKADRPESNRAWRAFQRLLLEGLQTSLTEVQAGQRDTQRILENLRGDLQAWADRMDALSADVRERTGEAALLQALTGMRDELLVAIATEAGLTRTAIETAVERIALLFSEDLARLRGDLLPLLGKRGLVEGQAPLRADLRRHFDALLQDYALFGGRAEELAAVHTFLADPQGGYLFITGPSGYGKTALLVQLALQGETAYHFFSRAFDTAGEDLFLRNLCQQLAARHGLGGQLPVSTAELRALYPDLLRLPPADGQPVVVLIDGLDEAANWEPGPLHFPADVPDGVKVIFSARQVADQDWLARLRLPRDRIRQLTLGAMTTEDVRSLLLAAGGSAALLADEPGWIAQALRVSAGDPFYLKLLVEDVRDGRMQPDQIEAQPAGLDEYLKGWWKQIENAVRAQDVRDLMGTLAVARGPVQRDDLIAMFPDLGWALDGVLAEVRRFVIGSEQQGYALCHPRFADYVRRRVGPRALQTYTDALLSYCANWREHHSPYALAHYAGHLAEAGRWEELHTLVATGDERQEWAEARFAQDGGYTGYLADLNLAWANQHLKLKQEKDVDCVQTALARCWRYALIASSINSLSGNYPPALVRRAIETGLWTTTQALGVAARIPDAEERATMFTTLLRTGYLSAAERDKALRNCVATSRAIWDQETRAQQLTTLASECTGELKAQILAEALAAAQAITEGSDRRALALASVARELTGSLKTETLEDAFASALADEDAPLYAEALAEVASLAEGQLLDRAFSLAQSMVLEEQRAMVLEALAPRLAGEAATQVLTAARMIWEVRFRFDVLIAFVPSLTGDLKAQVLADALAAAQAITDNWRRALALVELSRQCSGNLKTSLLADAAVAAQATEEDWRRASAFRVMAGELEGEAKARALSEALAASRAVRKDKYRADALTATAKHLTGKAQADVLSETLDAAYMLQPISLRSRALANMAPLLTGKRLAEALAATQTIEDTKCFADTLLTLATHLKADAKMATLKLALAVATAISGEISRARTLEVLAPHLTDDLMRTAVAAAQTMRDEELRLRTLTTFIPHLAGDARTAAVQLTLAAAHKIAGDRARARALTNLIPYLEGEAKMQAVSTALAAAEAIEESHHEGVIPANTARPLALIRLIPYLTEDAKARALERALDNKPRMRAFWQLARPLIGLLPYVSGELKAKTLVAAGSAVRSIDEDDARVDALAALASHLTDDAKSQALREALAVMQEMSHELTRADALRALAPHLTGELLEEARTTAQAIRQDEARSRALAALAPRMPVELRPQILADALAAARAIDIEPARAEVLIELTPVLTDELRADMLQVARAIKDEKARARVMAALVPYIGTPHVYHEVRLAIVGCLWSLRHSSREDVLRFCTYKILWAPPIVSTDMVTAIVRAVVDVGRWWP